MVADNTEDGLQLSASPPTPVTQPNELVSAPLMRNKDVNNNTHQPVSGNSSIVRSEVAPVANAGIPRGGNEVQMAPDGSDDYAVDDPDVPPSPSSGYFSALGSENGADEDGGDNNERLKIPTVLFDPETSDSTSSTPDDLLPRIRNAYRLLELFSEQGVGGMVDKVIIPQNSLRDLVDVLSPGAFEEMTKVSLVSCGAFPI